MDTNKAVTVTTSCSHISECSVLLHGLHESSLPKYGKIQGSGCHFLACRFREVKSLLQTQEAEQGCDSPWAQSTACGALLSRAVPVAAAKARSHSPGTASDTSAFESLRNRAARERAVLPHQPPPASAGPEDLAHAACRCCRAALRQRASAVFRFSVCSKSHVLAFRLTNGKCHVPRDGL